MTSAEKVEKREEDAAAASSSTPPKASSAKSSESTSTSKSTSPKETSTSSPTATTLAQPASTRAGSKSSSPASVTPNSATSTSNSSSNPPSPSTAKKGNAVTTKKSVNGENTGRWTKEEHATFIEGLNQHGKEWKKIANMIETRTVVQIRTHAQKYFQKIAKTKYEMKGKQPPTDLVSTASNPNRNSGDKKRGYRSSKTKNLKALYSLNSTCDPKENSPHNGSNMKKKGESKGSPANKRSSPLKPMSASRKKKKAKIQGSNPCKSSKGKMKVKAKGKSNGKSSLKLNLSEILKKESEASESTSPASKQGQKNLKIATNLAQLRKQNDEEDLQWMKSSLNIYSRMADASPTSVAEFGIYRTFGGCEQEYASFGGGNESGDLLSFDSESISDWMSNKSEDASTTTMDSPIDPALSPEPADCDPDALEGEVSVSGFGLNVDETIANWINSPIADEEECTLESFSGINNRPRLSSGDFVELM